MSSNISLIDSHVEANKTKKPRRRIKGKGTVTLPEHLFHVIPSSWAYLTIDEMLDAEIVEDFIDGNHGSLYPRKAEFQDTGYSFVTATQIRNGVVDFDQAPRLPEEKAMLLRKGWAEGGDVLLTHNATVGRVARVPNDTSPFLIGTSVTYYRVVREKLDRDYLYHFFCAPQWQGQLESIMAQTTRNQVSIQKQAFLRMPYPPREEQNRIVAAIESLQQRSAKARTLLTEVEPLIDKLRQSILQSAFSGRLTANWRAKNPDVEPADQLLARIRVERRQRWEDAELAKFEAKGKTPTKGWRDKYKEPEPVNESELPDLPEGWCWCQAKDLIETIDAGRSPTALSRPAEPGEAGVLKVSAVSWREFDPLANKALKRGDEIGDTPTPKKGDLIISRANTVELVGAIVLVKDDYPDLMLSDKTLRLNLSSEEIVTEYLLYSFRTELVRESFEANATGTSNSMRNLSQGKILDALIPLPPVMEQQLIADKLVANDEACGEISRTLSELVSSLTQLDRSILSKAFRGELVPQDPNDEPASELLARIQAASEAEASAKKVSKKKTTRKKKKASP